MGLPDIPFNSGQISGLAPDTIYFVYTDDPSFQGDANGPLGYSATQTKELAIAASGRFYVGSIRTPKPGAPPTVGAGDGGTGAQQGMNNTLSFSSVVQLLGPSGDVSGLQNFCDGDINSAATITITGASQDVSIQASVVPVQGRRFTSYTLRILYSVATNTYANTPGPTFQIRYSINSVTTNLVQLFHGQTAAPTIASASLPNTVNLTNASSFSLVIDCISGSSEAGGATQIANIFEAWIEAVE